MKTNGMQLARFNRDYCAPKGLELIKVTDEAHGSYFFWLILDPAKDTGQLDAVPEEEFDNTILVHHFGHLTIKEWITELDRAVNQIEKENLKKANHYADAKLEKNIYLPLRPRFQITE